MIRTLKLAAKNLLAPLLYHGYPVTLQMERVYLWLDVLACTQNVPGDVIEMGVMHGGTSVMARKFLRRLGLEKKYWAYDTFGGFVEKQVNAEVEKGLDAQYKEHFRVNSANLVRKIFKIHEVSDINIVQGDVSTKLQYPSSISAALIDVDLAEPTYHALINIQELLHHEGVIMVDDCHEIKEGYRFYRAEDGVKQFVEESGFTVNFIHNCALITKQHKFTNAYLTGSNRGL